MSHPPYRSLGPTSSVPPDPYLVAWAELKKHRIRRWIAFFVWAPLAGFVFSASEKLVGHPLGRGEFFAVSLPFVVAAVLFLVRASNFRCPQCGNRFEAQRMVSYPLTRRCLNCGIRIGTPKNTVASDAP